MEKEEALAEQGLGPPWIGQTDKYGREPCGEPEDVESIRCVREVSQEASKKREK